MAQGQVLRPRSRFMAAALSAALALGMAPAFGMAADSAYADDMTAAQVSTQGDEAPGYDWAISIGDAGANTKESTQNALSYVDSMNDVIALDDGSVVAAGGYDWKGLGDDAIPADHGGSDGVIAKYDSEQNEAFRTYVGGTLDDYFSAVSELSDGGFVAGGFAKSMDGDLSEIAVHTSGKYDGIIARFDKDGVLVGKTVVGGTDSDYVTDIAATSDGGFVAVGRFASKDGVFEGKRADSKSSGSAFIVKFDKDMNQQWLDVVDESSKSYDELMSVVEDAEGNIVASGYLAAPSDDVAKGGKDGVVVKYSKDGERQWLKVLGSSGNDEFWSVSTDVNAADGVSDAQGYVVAGYAKAADNDFGAVDCTVAEGAALPVMVRLDAEGNLVRAAALDAEALDATANIVAYEDGYLMAGSYKNASDQLGGADSKGDAYVARLHSDFSVASAMSFEGGEKDVVRAIALTADGKAVIAGRYLSTDFCGLELQGKADGFLMQVDPSKFSVAPTKQYTVPVAVKKVTDLTADSMAAGMVYEQANVKQYGEGDAARYEVTFYLQDATIMGMTVDAKGVKAVKYDSDGDGASDSLVDRDVYLPYKHVREVTVTVSDLSKAIIFNTCPSNMPSMPDAALCLDGDEMVEVDEAPEYFVDDKEVATEAQKLIDAAAANPTDENVAAARAAYNALTDDQKALLADGAEADLKTAETAVSEAKAAADKAAADKAAAEKAAALAAASTVNTATLTPAQVKKASDLGATTITLGPKVKKIAKNAFKGTKVKTIVVKTKKLKKKSVKGSLKGSKVKTVKVQIGSKKVNKKYVKKYKKIFTKKVAGKKAKVTA